jgi:hypothetical protein
MTLNSPYLRVKRLFIKTSEPLILLNLGSRRQKRELGYRKLASKGFQERAVQQHQTPFFALALQRRVAYLDCSLRP